VIALFLKESKLKSIVKLSASKDSFNTALTKIIGKFGGKDRTFSVFFSTFSHDFFQCKEGLLGKLGGWTVRVFSHLI